MEGNHVKLRPLEEQDLDLHREMINDPEIQAMTIGATGHKNTEYDVRRWFDLISSDPHSEQWAVLTADGQFIGDIDLHSINSAEGEAWIAPMIGDARYRHDEKLRREAVSLILTYVYKEKGVDRVLIEVPDVDEQGIQLLLDLGFEHVDEYEVDPFSGAKVLIMEAQKP